MNRQELYYKTVDLLLDAYNSGELEHGNCQACAVGNICGGSSNWTANFVTTTDGQQHRRSNMNFTIYSRWSTLSDKERNDAVKRADILIASTGYTEDELALIEFAFETSIQDSRYYFTVEYPKKGQFIGLTATLRVLAEIHETDIEDSTQSQEKLQKIYDQKLVVA